VAEAGELKIIGTDFWLMNALGAGHSFTGEEVDGTFGEKGRLKVKGDYIHYMDWHGDQRRLLGSLTGNTGEAGDIRIKGRYLYYMDYSEKERVLIKPIYPVMNFSGWVRHYEIPPPYFTWDELREQVGNDTNYGTNIYMANVAPAGQEDKWQTLTRGILTFDTSEIVGNVSAAFLYFKVSSKEDTLGLAPDIVCVSVNPQGEEHLEGPDYSEFGTLHKSDILPWTSHVLGEYSVFTLSPSSIVDGDLTHLGIRVRKDITGVDPTWIADTGCALSSALSEVYLIVLED